MLHVRVIAIGKMKEQGESALIQRYFERFSRICKAQGIDFAGVDVIAESRLPTAEQRQSEEAEKLLKKISSDSFVIVLDERGKHLSSPQFAEVIAQERDKARNAVIFLLGGPDGHAPSIRARADLLLCLGKMTWPHQLARLLLAEQLYRAVTILSGHPYHRI